MVQQYEGGSLSDSARIASALLQPGQLWRLTWLVLLAAGLAACAGRAPPLEFPGASQEGVASYYGARFHGRQTANGERFDMHAMTAAHPSLPFDTRVRVTHLDSGRQIVVRINDRGPFIKGRIIDLSRSAAEKLGMIRSGVARVRVERLN
ncbi:MAG: septal ring lytic transglycosylase RlpA family lipoprotein [Salinisphaeraceae bacterium]|nr:septal ring lytic transglycosylase RlpA family lipoprotein [Salinisphaeraceae bacterium]